MFKMLLLRFLKKKTEVNRRNEIYQLKYFKKIFKNNVTNRKNNKFNNLFKINYVNNYWIEHEISKKISNFFIYLYFMNYHKWFIWFTNELREHSAYSIHEWISWAFSSFDSRMNFVNIQLILFSKKRLYNS